MTINKNIYGRSGTIVQEKLRELINATHDELQEETGLSYGSVKSALKAMHEGGQCHISGYVKEGNSSSARVFTIGWGEDAVKTARTARTRDAHIQHKREPEKPFIPHPDIAASWIPRQSTV